MAGRPLFSPTHLLYQSAPRCYFFRVAPEDLTVYVCIHVCIHVHIHIYTVYYTVFGCLGILDVMATISNSLFHILKL